MGPTARAHRRCSAGSRRKTTGCRSATHSMGLRSGTAESTGSRSSTITPAVGRLPARVRRTTLICRSSVDTVTNTMRRLGSHRKSRPGTGHSLPDETETQLSEREKLAEDLETELMRTRQQLAIILRAAAQHAVKAIADRVDGGGTAQLADIAYAFACLEGAQRGILPGTPPPPKNSAAAAIPPRQPTSSPQSGPGLPSAGDPTRRYS